MQAQLQFGASIHAFKNRLVLLFQKHVDAGRQKLRGAVDPFGQRALSRGDGLTGADRRRQSPVGEFLKRLHARDPLFAQFADARLDERVIGVRRGKTVLALDDAAFNFRLQAGQPIQKLRLVDVRGIGHGRRNFGQFALRCSEARPEFLRDRQRQKRHNAIDLDLKKALHNAPRVPRRHRPVLDQKPREAVAVDAKVGERDRGATGDLRADDRIAVEKPLRHQRLILAVRQLVHERRVRRRNEAAGQVRHPLGGGGLDGGRCERISIVRLRQKRVAREFGVSLPDQLKPAEIDIVVLHARSRRRRAELFGQFRDELTVFLLIRRIGRQRDAGKPDGRRQRLRRTGVHLIAEGKALNVICRQSHLGLFPV